MYIQAHTCTHTQRGPCNFHVEQGEGVKEKEYKEKERGLKGTGKGLQCQKHSNQCQMNKRREYPIPPPKTQRVKGVPHETITTSFLF